MLFYEFLSCMPAICANFFTDLTKVLSSAIEDYTIDFNFCRIEKRSLSEAIIADSFVN